MKFKVFSTLVFLICPWIANGQTLAYKDQSDCVNGSDGGDVVIKAATRTLTRSAVHHIKYTFHSLGSYAVYNWQFNRLKPLPGQLAIYDANKQYIGDLIGWTDGSHAGIGDDDWSFLYGESYVGKPLSFSLNHIPNSKYMYGLEPLPLGTYYIQLVMYRAFFSLNPFRTFGDKIDFYGTFDRSELCRSNAIKFEIVDQ